MEYTKEEKAVLFDKLNKARKAVQECDWEKDKFLSYGGKTGYKYLSVEKMKRNLAPIFQRFGLELSMRFYDLVKHDSVGQMSQHWVVSLDVDVIDISTGCYIRSTVYGEAGDSGDKGVSKAQTYALKQWMANNFLLIDGIDPDAEDEDVPVKTFVPKSGKEQEEVKSKVLQNAIPAPKKAALPDSGDPVSAPAPAPKSSAPTPAAPKPPAPKPPTPTPKAAPTPVPKPATPTPAPAAPAPAPKPMTPAEEALAKLKAEKIAGFEPSKPQQNMINRIKEVWEERALKGEVSVEEYNAMSYDCATIGDATEAVAFIKKYRVDE